MVHLLEAVDGGVQFVPFLFLGGEQDQHQVGADGEVFALVGDDHGVEVGLQLVEAGVEHADLVFAQGVHFAVEFAAEDAVAEIDQGGAGVRLYDVAGALQIGQGGAVRRSGL